MTADGSSALTEGFNRLLALLDPEPERAATAYTSVQRKLATFFEWRGCPDGAIYADITLERVAKRLGEGAGEGATVTTANLYSFIMGFATTVLREDLREPDRRAEPLEDAHGVPASPAVEPIDERGGREAEDRRFAYLDQCVGRLPAEQRHALLTYHEGRAKTRIGARNQMAMSFGIPVSALRLRMFRIRRGLERCILQCMGVSRLTAK